VVPLVDHQASEIVALAPELCAKVVGRVLDSELYGVGMSLHAPDLVRFVNAVLERARSDGSLAESDQRWLSRALNPVPQPAPARYRD